MVFYLSSTCPSCGQPLATNANFCASCGVRLAAPSSAGSSASIANQSLRSIFSQSEYVVEKNLLTSGVGLGSIRSTEDTFEIKDKSGSLLASVKRKGFDTGDGLRVFIVETPSGEQVAELRKNVFQLGDLMNMDALKDKPSYEAFDSTGRLFASIKHKPSKPGARFSADVPCIIDNNGQEIARLDYGGIILSKQWTLKSSDSLTIATIRTQTVPRETYTVEIVNFATEPYVILLTLFGMIPESTNMPHHPHIHH